MSVIAGITRSATLTSAPSERYGPSASALPSAYAFSGQAVPAADATAVAVRSRVRSESSISPTSSSSSHPVASAVDSNICELSAPFIGFKLA